ncbi:MAG: Gamma-butyrobetaine dioxygenase [Acidobacteria bacterium OLB17]|nr:MAG: Gamma-butyrobetaine dioxygenase [Acidobacteria bacterium OLB17]MCZ2389508.1 DUF971 domain-containing protein [Acidobacteriota bacterium]
MLEPIQIVEESDTEFTITWSDDSQTRYNALFLRRRCPCAMCINEWTGEKMLVDESIPDDIKITSTAVVGRYALNFVFSDQHDSGIFSFQYLREIAE